VGGQESNYLATCTTVHLLLIKICVYPMDYVPEYIFSDWTSVVANQKNNSIPHTHSRTHYAIRHRDYFFYTCTLINYTLIVFFKLYFYYSGEQHVKLC